MAEILPLRGNREQEPPFIDTLEIRIPDDMDPYNTHVMLLSSKDDTDVQFSMPKDSEIFANVQISQENIAKALLSGERVEFSIVGQEDGDSVTISYTGKSRNYGMVTTKSSVYKFTNEHGWRDVNGGIVLFEAKKGPQVTFVPDATS